jgi:hypothetical protein
MPADDDGRLVDIEQQQLFLWRDIPNQKFFQGKVQSGVMLILIIDKEHRLLWHSIRLRCAILKACSPSRELIIAESWMSKTKPLSPGKRGSQTRPWKFVQHFTYCDILYPFMRMDKEYELKKRYYSKCSLRRRYQS